jgi:nitroreductase
MTELRPDWYKAINVRCSRRNYDKARHISAETRDRLHFACNSFRPYKTARVEFISEPPNDIFANALGFYGNIKNAPAFLAFIGDMSDPQVQEKMGYTGEAIVLEATSLGLGTCWVALTYKASTVQSMISLSGQEKLIAVSPVGYSMEQWTFEEKMFSGFGPNHKRNRLSSMVSGLPQEQWPGWAKSAVEAARLAPSAVNRQPWRFDIGEKGITVSARGAGPEFNVARRLDCGIAMLHVELGALSGNAHGSWELLKSPDVGRFQV